MNRPFLLLAALPLLTGAAPATIEPAALAALFGVQASVPPPEKERTPEPEPAPATLRLRLIGTISARDAAHALALVETRDGLVLAREGTELPGATVVRIQRRRVLVRHDETLSFLELFTDPRSPRASPAPTAAPDTASWRVTSDRYRVPASERDALLADLPNLASSVRVVPAFVNGTLTGYKVFSLRPGSPLARLGFQNGDVVRSVNGRPVTDLEALSGLAGQAGALKKVVVEVSRRGQPKHWTVEVDED